MLEYDGQNYVEIAKDRPWYYRVVKETVMGSILFGQKQKTGGSDPFEEAIFEMVWENSAYEPVQRILPPNRANLMGFAFGDVLNDGRELPVTFNQADHIRILSPGGKEIWKGAKQYGGSSLYFEKPKADIEDTSNPHFFPMRLYVNDIDGDGKNEVITVNNHDEAGRHLERFRKYTNFQIVSISWDGLGLSGNWKTREHSGHVRDFVFGDFDNDGRDELVATVILKGGAVVGTNPRSSLIAYELK